MIVTTWPPHFLCRLAGRQAGWALRMFLTTGRKSPTLQMVKDQDFLITPLTPKQPAVAGSRPRKLLLSLFLILDLSPPLSLSLPAPSPFLLLTDIFLFDYIRIDKMWFWFFPNFPSVWCLPFILPTTHHLRDLKFCNFRSWSRWNPLQNCLQVRGRELGDLLCQRSNHQDYQGELWKIFHRNLQPAGNNRHECQLYVPGQQQSHEEKVSISIRGLVERVSITEFLSPRLPHHLHHSQ